MRKEIILADDYDMTRLLIDQALKTIGIGYKLSTARDGATALDFFDGRTVDLLITDYDMPELNGQQLITQVQDMPLYAEVPVIMLTASRQNYAAMKQNPYIRINRLMLKPYKLDDFKRSLHVLLKL